MSDEILKELQHEARVPSRMVADHVSSRTVGAPLIPGDKIRLLRDAAENYSAWLEAISTAKAPFILRVTLSMSMK